MTLDDETMAQLGFQQSEVHSSDFPRIKLPAKRETYAQRYHRLQTLYAWRRRVTAEIRQMRAERKAGL